MGLEGGTTKSFKRLGEMRIYWGTLFLEAYRIDEVRYIKTDGAGNDKVEVYHSISDIVDRPKQTSWKKKPCSRDLYDRSASPITYK